MLFEETVAAYSENHTSLRISQEAHYVSVTKPNRLMLFGEAVTVYYENHTEHTNKVCRQIRNLFNTKPSWYI
jgi:hypothetical protein